MVRMASKIPQLFGKITEELIPSLGYFSASSNLGSGPIRDKIVAIVTNYVETSVIGPKTFISTLIFKKRMTN